MVSKICMNEACRTTTSSEWKNAWGLKSGGFATLCHRCGSAYENSVFCETFHLEESGWRECRICRKRIHCGCIASKLLHEYLDAGGIGCIGCVKHLEARTVRPVQVQIPGEIGNDTLVSNGIGNVQSVDNNRIWQLGKAMNGNEPVNFFKSQNHGEDLALRQPKEEETMLPKVSVSTYLPNISQHLSGSSSFKKPDRNRPIQGVKEICGTPAQPSLDISLGTTLGASSSSQSFSGSEGKEQNKGSPFQQGQRTHHTLPKAPKAAPSTSAEANKGPSVTRVARPPVEGRGRNQLLPRYWPRMTDQELKKLSGDLNSTIIPLFEKILSASDAGRIGRLVLPKACAEAYFPPINQSDGVPIRMQDVKGKEWTFQFRFWPNNNSRMYVLEGVTPCIQNMGLQAGDTVIFSRIDPGGKLVMGFRKATNNNIPDGQTNTVPNGGSTGEATFSGVNEHLSADGSRTSDDNVPRLKKARNIGAKNKRLLIHSEDAMELRVTWQEAQELFRPPASRPTNIILIEGEEFEEYDEPPVIGKKTIFTARLSGEQDQWAQCDTCYKWRRLPADILLPAKWSCFQNTWDPKRSSCSFPGDISQKELDALLQGHNDLIKRQKLTEHRAAEESEPSGLDALATAAVLGDNMGDLGGTSVGVTTKHPRHRPGCSCIVCIQPPSGKGKHPSSCKCIVCLTVRRRFKTLMQRKKKRQSEHEAELARQIDQTCSKNDSETDMAAEQEPLQVNPLENDRTEDENQIAGADKKKGHLDLNFHPNREDELLTTATGMSMTNLVNSTNLPLEMYLTRTGNGVLAPCSLSQTAGNGEGSVPDGDNTSTADVQMDNKDENGNTTAS